MRIKRMVLAALTATGITTAMTVAAVLPAQAAPASDPTLCGCGDKPPFAVGTDSAGNDYVFYAGADSGLWEKSSTDNYAAQEILKPPIGPDGDADVSAGDGNSLAVAVHPNGELDVFWQGQNGPDDLYEVSYVPGKGWGSLQNLGGPGPSNVNFDGLTAGSDANGNDYLFWDNDGQLWEKWHYSSGWNGPALIYNASASNPQSAIDDGLTVAVHPDGQQDVFWEGNTAPNNPAVSDTYEDSYANGAWSGPKNLGELSTDGWATWPAAGADASNDDFLYWQNGNGGLYEQWWIGSTRYGGANYQLLNADRYGNSTGPAVAVHGNGTQDVFWYEGTDTTPVLMEYSWNGSSWSGPTSRGGF